MDEKTELERAAGELVLRRYKAGVPSLDPIRDFERPEPPLPPSQWIETNLLKDDPIDGPRYESDRDGLRAAAEELLAKQRAADPAPQNSIGQLINYLRTTR
jgi:hypothetical protein